MFIVNGLQLCAKELVEKIEKIKAKKR